jgi:hypothetical protein
MTKELIILVLVGLGIWSTAYSQSGSTIPIVGCYSDISLTKDKEEIVGNGSYRTRKQNGRYVAFFSELISDSGEQTKPKRVENLHFDKQTRRFTFDLPLDRGGHPEIIRNVSGRITEKGIKMNWNKNAGEFGEKDPFMRRRTRNCT